MELNNTLAIAMWDFSWLERRGKGEGFECWETAVSELVERGYDAVRIEPYVQMIALEDNGKTDFPMGPVWADCAWGSVVPITLTSVLKNLIDFMMVCKSHNVAVALSSWYRGGYAEQIDSAEKLAKIWINLINHLSEAGLYDSILYVDFCNEYPAWAPFIKCDADGKREHRDSEYVSNYTNTCIKIFKNSYPNIDVTFSVSADFYRIESEDLTNYDFLEPHIWVNSDGDGRFDSCVNKEKPFKKSTFETERDVYYAGKKYWKEVLESQIEWFAKLSKEHNLPLITTECWAVVFYVENELGWDWIKELCEIGVRKAVETKRFKAIATSNFCAPQFPGMWNDIKWHKMLTDLIHSK